MNKAKTIAVICARGGSKGLPGKNLKHLRGETLLGRAVRHALAATLVDDVIVSTDDESIAVEARRCGAIVPFIRPTSLAGDLTTTEETLQHALLETEERLNTKYDICVFLTATDIFRSLAWIDQAVDTLITRPELESVFVGYKTHKNFWEQSPDGSWQRVCPWMSTYASRQVRRFIVREDTGLACASRAFLWREGRRIGDHVDIIVQSDEATSIDIHHQEDLELAEYVLKLREEAPIQGK